MDFWDITDGFRDIAHYCIIGEISRRGETPEMTLFHHCQRQCHRGTVWPPLMHLLQRVRSLR